MMERRVSLLILTIAWVHLSACSVIKSYFPDKKKDYQLAVEISPLVIPADLNHLSNQGQSINRLTPAKSATDHLADQKHSSTGVELVTFNGGTSRIRLGGSIEQSWRRVGKALSRNSIEIVARDEIDRVFKVQYDPEFKKQSDDSIWDELVFIFGDDPVQEQTLQIKLVENTGLIEVMVLDEQGKPLSEGYALKLLKQLRQTLQQDSK